MTWRVASFLAWGALGVLLVAAGLVARSSGGRWPDLRALMARLTAGALRRSVVVLAWMWLGWHAFAR